MVDVTGAVFPEFMKNNVLSPLGMKNSTYQQPLPPELAKLTATGHYNNRSLVEGRWHIYPEMAAAGLWTTPSDLARFAISIQNANAGNQEVQRVRWRTITYPRYQLAIVFSSHLPFYLRPSLYLRRSLG
jgi:CubicO group peptidase (beta-lactamase class C family)